jgi:flavin reductase (DIM6/NTAB) family NADH-FMN oxidoreductase RutF
LVKPPRVAEAPISLECKTWKTIELPAAKPDIHNIMVLGEVVGVHIADNALDDDLIDTVGLRPVARLGYLDYLVVDGAFAIEEGEDND